jgi:hypothetical protein
MSVPAKIVTLFLMDGVPTGRVKVGIANWTGLAYRIPRSELENCDPEKPEGISCLKYSGVYFLFSPVDNSDGANVVYIGQAGFRKSRSGLYYRLMEHKRDPEKDFWTEAIVFTTTTDTLGNTELNYLENRFCNLAFDAKRYYVKNDVDPSPGKIIEEKESELEEFVYNARIVIGTLGHNVFKPLVKIPSYTSALPEKFVAKENFSDKNRDSSFLDREEKSETSKVNKQERRTANPWKSKEKPPRVDKSKSKPAKEVEKNLELSEAPPSFDHTYYANEIFFINRPGVEAKMVVTEDGYTVLRGSVIRFPKNEGSYSDKIKEIRRRAKRKLGQNGALLRDYSFTSVTAAAEFVLGVSCNASTEWKTADGKTIKEF